MTSQYLQIYDGILLEYEYTSLLNPEGYFSTDYQIEIVKDAQNTITYLFNTKDNYSTTTNIRDYSAVLVDNNTYAYLNIDLPLNYLDYNNNFTGTGDLLITSYLNPPIATS